jgi:peroxiredoxin/outer membrane lipoprotein-sorting protein
MSLMIVKSPVFLLAATTLISVSASAMAATPEVAAKVPPIVQKYVDAVGNAKAISLTVSMASTGALPSEKSRYALAQPNLALVSCRLGNGSEATLVSDGKNLWQWSNKKYTKYEAPPKTSDIRPDLHFGLATTVATPILFNPKAVAAVNGLVDMGTETVNGVATHKVKVTGGGDAYLWIASDTGFPVQVTLADGANSYKIAFSDYKTGDKADKDFSARPPKDATLFTPPPPPPAPPILLPVGTPAPDFTLQTTTGKSVSLSSLRGKVILLNFWSSAVEPSTTALASIQKLYDKFQGKGLAVLSVNTLDKPEDRAAFLKAHPELTSTFLIDPSDTTDSVAGGKYKVAALPTIYLISKDGAIAARYIGFDESHLPEVIADLAKLGVK